MHQLTLQNHELLTPAEYVTFGYMLSQIRLSVVWNVHAAYSAVELFWQYFFITVYLSHSMTSCKILRRSSQGNPRRER